LPPRASGCAGCEGSPARERGRGEGAVADALNRAVRDDRRLHDVLIDAKDGLAGAFYTRHDFLAFSDTPPTLFLPLAAMRG